MIKLIGYLSTIFPIELRNWNLEMLVLWRGEHLVQKQVQFIRILRLLVKGMNIFCQD